MILSGPALPFSEKGSSRYPVATVIFFATTGFVSGYFLSVWNPGSERQATKEALVMWIGLIGDLFLRALKCVVLPLGEQLPSRASGPRCPDVP